MVQLYKIGGFVFGRWEVILPFRPGLLSCSTGRNRTQKKSLSGGRGGSTSAPSKGSIPFSRVGTRKNKRQRISTARSRCFTSLGY